MFLDLIRLATYSLMSLPKRRLRARLSPEQADSISYPSPPVSSPPVFDFPYTHPDKVASISTRQQRGEKEHKCSCGADHSDQESEEDDDERLGWSQPRRKISGKGLLTLEAATGGLGNGASKPLPPGSTSSADGYESFENTNNKKKRKIPVSGSAGHHGNLTAEMASMGISTHGGDGAHDGENNVGQYYGSGSSAMPAPGSGTGISGAGRGRARTNGAMANGKAANYDHGIISTAIANANAAGHSAQQNKGKENVSLLQQEAAKSTPQKTQFTFTCGSPNQPAWPKYTNYHHPPSRDDIWICEFCEYEDIFGEPPRALIRQYEIKDRKEQKRMAEKRRLLEKAKMKGRKGKKAAKSSKAGAAANNQHSQQQQASQHGYDHQGHPDGTIDGQDEYFEDDYDDGVAPPDVDADVDAGSDALADSDSGGTHGGPEPVALGKSV
ncbi:Protein ibd2 [Neofusicoccum parvum]|uniref:Uncharacterized protein n=2 Tax=Neofusicoccum parvum TaxID=310453 RepID=R1EPI3_BOTPV|nr:hypothetical protein UCRNP2_3794 [Neofusicoccum parvum UCRNP2]GME46336.1 Protein ibd2 [Neofusicoccum parvum]GME64084.1 Protein ibd2 [Neofusicoccum parvum]